MPVRVNFHPNRISITPHPTTKHFIEEFESPSWGQHLNSMQNLRKRGNPFLMSSATKRRLRDRVTAMYRLATPRTVVTTSQKLIYNFRCAFITLTLPASQSHTDKEIKELALNQLLIELRKHYKMENYVWKAELQANQNIHFHIFTDTFIQFHALQRRWNRILKKLGYIEAFQNRMQKMDFETYFENARKYNKNLRKIDALNRYKKGLSENWANPNSVDVRVVKSDRMVTHYMSKYLAKDIVNKEQESYTEEEEALLQRGQDFGRSWFCSRSVSRLKTSFSFSISEVEEIFEKIEQHENTKEFSGMFYRVFYFYYDKLEEYIQGFMRGWLMHNAYLSGYNYT